MKTILLTLLLTPILLGAATPNFEKIFKEIKAAKTATESIEVREKFLKQMRNLYDFDRLTNLEKLNKGEHYFDHYKLAIANFVVDNVDRFMLDQRSQKEQDIYARNILKKAFNKNQRHELFRNGLFYVEDCEDFYSYFAMTKAPRKMIYKHAHLYCGNDGVSDGHDNGHPGYGDLEVISNTSLNAGEYKTIYLPSYQYVSKLYISAQGIGRDASFDVMVNGDIKGTIYVPGRDPLYIVNVQAQSNAINLRSHFGNVQINSIKVD